MQLLTLCLRNASMQHSRCASGNEHAALTLCLRKRACSTHAVPQGLSAWLSWRWSGLRGLGLPLHTGLSLDTGLPPDPGVPLDPQLNFFSPSAAGNAGAGTTCGAHRRRTSTSPRCSLASTSCGSSWTAGHRLRPRPRAPRVACTCTATPRPALGFQPLDTPVLARPTWPRPARCTPLCPRTYGLHCNGLLQPAPGRGLRGRAPL